MPCIKYIEKSFHKASFELISTINAIITEYHKQGYSLTLRQVYYQLVSRDIISNNEKSYNKVGNLLSCARLAGLTDWNGIEDRTRRIRENAHWNSPAEILEDAISSYAIDKWKGQPYYIECWVEKDALIEVVGQICKILDINYFSCRGYTSQSELWKASQRMIEKMDENRQPVILHLGDHDPSGLDMSRDIQDRLNLFGADILFRRLALNIGQVEEYNLPPNPAKLTDTRAREYIKEYGPESWELDAIEPSIISSLIEDAVLDFRQDSIFKYNIECEKNDRKQLAELLQTVSYG